MTYRVIGRPVSPTVEAHTHPGLAPRGGIMGQVLAKTSSLDFATGWVNLPAGGDSDSGDSTVSRRIYNAVNHGIII